MLKGKRADRKLTAGLAAVLFALVMARFCAFGMEYYHQLDDYIQYHNYPSSGDFMALQRATGLLASRPLAGIADFFVWGPMFDHMIWGVALISVMYVAAVLVIWNILGRYFRVSPVLPVIMALLPLGIEGTYWMSASTRVVVGILFAVGLGVGAAEGLSTMAAEPDTGWSSVSSSPPRTPCTRYQPDRAMAATQMSTTR